MKKMKKIILGLLAIVILGSCSSDSGSSSSNGTLKWGCKINGVNYQYSGSYADIGQGLFQSVLIKSGNTTQLSLSSDINDPTSIDIGVNANISSNLGQTNYNPSNPKQIIFQLDFNADSITPASVYSSIVDGSDFNINLQNLPQSSSEISLQLAKGTFSGVLYKLGGDGPETITVTNGYFEAYASIL
jgi:hypothetical protein